MNKLQRYLLTFAVLVVAVSAIAWKYKAYLLNPWTRDGQVMANVVQVSPRVSGPIVELPIVDNQGVKAGDLLFRIDPRTYEAAVAEARANLALTEDTLAALTQEIGALEASVEQYEVAIPKAESEVRAAVSTVTEAARNLERLRILLRDGNTPQSRFDAQQRTYDVAVSSKEQADIALLAARSALAQAKATLAQALANRGKPRPNNARLNAAEASLRTAELNLEFTEVRAPVDGYVTNVDLRLGYQAVANKPALALIDTSSYWIDAYFRETLVSGIQPGDQAVVTLMGYPSEPIEGVVESINKGIAQSDGSTGNDLLPNVSPTFEWIRLAQRIPVRIRLKQLPKAVELTVGATASVLVRTGGKKGDLVAVPVPLQ